MTDYIDRARASVEERLAKAQAKREAERLAKMPKERAKPAPVKHGKPYDFEKAKRAYKVMSLAACATYVGVRTARLRADFEAAGVPLRSAGGNRRPGTFKNGEGWVP